MQTPLTDSSQFDLVCLSHLRWNFVFQRPQHLMSRFARRGRVFFVEEPVFDSAAPSLKTVVCQQTGVHVVTPNLGSDVDRNGVLTRLLSEFFQQTAIRNPVAWFYTPMALEFFPPDISPRAIVYDCMDELSMFLGAPPQLCTLEERLLRMADLVFTGGVSLFEFKRHRHPRMYPFPSGVDVPHFMQARNLPADFQEHRDIGRPRLGYAGVIDERIDLALIDEVSRTRPEWQFIMIGPTAKIGEDTLPRRANIHWLGMKAYADLPRYFAGWDAGIMPFALNDSTRFISPTRTPEYLAAGLPVISTAIRDVVRPYGELGLVHVVATPAEFITVAEKAMNRDMSLKWRERADNFLTTLSWNSVWEGMSRLVHEVVESPAQTTIRLAPAAGTEAARV
jgi:UDP-galactopyranose mutase